jgi:hypothetical protein
MSSQEFSIQYPLFALKRGSGYVGYDLGQGQLGGKGLGVLVFTTEANVLRYLILTRTEAQVKSFDRPSVFRQFLRSIDSPEKVVLFDLLPDALGRLHTSRIVSPAVLLERFLPEPGFLWSYPVYFLRCKEGLACIDTLHEGRPLKALVVFTDSDLAERAVAEAPEHLAIASIEDRQTFAQLVRGLSPDIGGAIFDPPDPRREGRVQSGILRPELLANLELEL